MFGSQLFDVSTTIDPGYIISLIRNLLPPNVMRSHSEGVGVIDAKTEASNVPRMEGGVTSSYENVESTEPSSRTEPTDTLNRIDKYDCLEGANAESCQKVEHSNALLRDQACEECGCILWDLAASRKHAEFMVQNYLLEVLLANITVSESMRIKEISLGIIGNLTCHEVPAKQIVSVNGLLGIVLDQLFVDDTPCLCETFRLLTIGLQGSEGITWAEAVQSEQILIRLLWIAENTLNPQLMEKSLKLLLAIIESELEVAPAILSSLINLGLPAILINILSFEMRKLMSEQIPERYHVLDLVLRVLEALTTIDDYSKEICLIEELFKMVYDLVRLPDKAEVAECCVTAVVLLANILGDAPDLASRLTQDLDFLQGLLDVLPFASDDLEARSAIWSILDQVLFRVQDVKSPLALHQYVSVLSRNSELIEDELLNQQLDRPEGPETLVACGANSHARDVALKRIINILNRWLSSNDRDGGDFGIGNDLPDDRSVNRLLDICCDHVK